jgi:hypothetical protein
VQPPRVAEHSSVMSVVDVSSYIKKRGAWLAYSGERREPGPRERADTREIGTTHDLAGSAGTWSRPKEKSKMLGAVLPISAVPGLVLLLHSSQAATITTLKSLKLDVPTGDAMFPAGAGSDAIKAPISPDDAKAIVDYLVPTKGTS